MRVLQIGPIPPNWGGGTIGGVAKHIEDLSTYLEKTKNHIYIYSSALKKYNKVSERIEIFGRTNIFFFLKVLLSVDIRALWFLMVESKSLRRFISNVISFYDLKNISINNVDCIHVHSLHNNITRIIPLVFGEIPIVITDHGFWQNISEENKLQKIKEISKNIKFAKKVVFISNYSKLKLQEFKLFNDKFVNVGNPVSLEYDINLSRIEARKRLGISSEKKVIFFNGYSESIKRKGLGLLIDAMCKDRCLDQDYAIIIIADHEGHDFVNSCLSDTSNVFIYGKQNWDVIQLMYKAADSMVLPSSSESFGLVYIEALLAGCSVVGFKPVLTEFKKSLKGLDSDVIFGYRPEEGKAALREKIDKALNNSLSKHDIEKVENHFSWASNIRKFNMLYKDCQTE